MNKRLTWKNDFNETVYCVLSSETDYEAQLETVFNIKKGYGFSVRFNGKTIKIVDYFHGDTRASFDVVSLEDTEEDVLYQITKLG